jgi:hypothetical protein
MGMYAIAFKMLFRRKGTVSTVLALALLIALIASVNSLVNNVNSQTSLLSKFAAVGKDYLVVSENSSSLLDSVVDFQLADSIRNLSGVDYVVGQIFLPATVAVSSGNYTVFISCRLMLGKFLVKLL